MHALMAERRRSIRYPINFPVRIDAPEKADRLGVSHDVSTSGMLLLTRSRFRLGQRLELRFRTTQQAVERCVHGRVVRLSVSWNHFFPRRVAVAFDGSYGELEPVLSASAGA